MQTQTTNQTNQKTNYGNFITSDKWNKKRHQKKTEIIKQEPVRVNNQVHTTSDVYFANYKRGAFDYDLALVVDGHAQIFRREQEFNEEAIDPVDPQEFKCWIKDFDNDGDDDILVSYITKQKNTHEKVEIMSFENDGTGCFSQVGFSTEQPRWLLATARCFNGTYNLSDADYNRNLYDLELTPQQQAGANAYAFDVHFHADDGTQNNTSFSFYNHSTQLDFNSMVINGQNLDDINNMPSQIKEQLASLQETLEEYRQSISPQATTAARTRQAQNR